MKKKLFKLTAVTLVFAVIISTFSTTAVAASVSKGLKNEEKLVQELAEQLKFVWEEASIKDEFENVIGVDVKKIENKYGPSPKLAQKAFSLYFSLFLFCLLATS